MRVQVHPFVSPPVLGKRMGVATFFEAVQYHLLQHGGRLSSTIQQDMAAAQRCRGAVKPRAQVGRHRPVENLGAGDSRLTGVLASAEAAGHIN